jgi:hypothetical protein
MPFRNKLAATALCGLSCSLLLGTAFAQSESAELIIEPFPRAEVAQKRVERNVEHGVVIGSIRRINNQLRAEREVRTTGDLIRVSWLIPPGHDSTEALMSAKRQLLEREHAMLFFCEGRECGSSSIWANQVLGFSRLYGPEDGQAYIALRIDDEPQRFVSLYSITRGNRQVYLHIDQFTPSEPVEGPLYPTPATLLKVIRADGHLSVPAVDMESIDSKATQSWLDLLNRALRTDTSLRVQVNGAQAPAFVQGLRDRGIRSDRLEIGEPIPDMGVRLVKL